MSASLRIQLMLLARSNRFSKSTALGYFENNSSSGSTTLPVVGEAVVPIDVGNRRVTHSVIESPKNWFEDFGSAQLSGGVARVTLDPDFAQTLNTGMEYHVFLTPNGDCKGLYVSQKTATSFEVHELGGSASSVSFDYRIVAQAMESSKWAGRAYLRKRSGALDDRWLRLL